MINNEQEFKQKLHSSNLSTEDKLELVQYYLKELCPRIEVETFDKLGRLVVRTNSQDVTVIPGGINNEFNLDKAINKLKKNWK